MPFTPSHAAAALPFARLRKLPLSALIVGTMSPDFLYFVVLDSAPKFSHKVPGLFAFSVPAGLVVLWLFHRLLKRPLLALLPRGLQERAAPCAGPFAFGPGKRFAWILTALLIGAATHAAWDAFTYAEGLGVALLPVLEREVDVGYFVPMPLYRVVQHVSTAVGGLILAVWFGVWYRRARAVPLRPRFRPAVRMAIVCGLLLGTLAVGVLYASRFDGLFGQPHWVVVGFLKNTVLAGIAAGFILSVVYALLWRRTTDRKPPTP